MSLGGAVQVVVGIVASPFAAVIVVAVAVAYAAE